MSYKEDLQRAIGNTYTVPQIWQQLRRHFPHIDPPSDYRVKELQQSLEDDDRITEGLKMSRRPFEK